MSTGVFPPAVRIPATRCEERLGRWPPAGVLSGRLGEVSDKTASSRESLAEILGGRRGALDASVPPVAFVVGWLVAGRSVAWGAAMAIVVAAVLAAFRLVKGQRVTAVVVSLAGVVAAALIALHTGRAEDFFLLQLLSNVASALLFAASIVVRWPLLGVVVGVVLGQKTRWRRDPALVKAYSRASWLWVAQYGLRVVVYGLLWGAGQVLALGVARTVLSWPLVALTLTVSGWVLYRTLPDDHPGLRLAASEPTGQSEEQETEK
jgi:Protein of unknown function (DUF3159)